MFNQLLLGAGIVLGLFITAILVLVVVWLGCDLIFGEYHYWKKIGNFFVKVFRFILAILICICGCIVYAFKTRQRHREARQSKIFKLSNAFLDFKSRV